MVQAVRKVMAVATLAAAVAVGGCGDTGANEPWDPIEPANRFVFSINRAVDVIAIRPIAVLYRDWMPAPAQRGLHNVLENLGEPVTAIAEVVQGTPGRAGTTLARFLVPASGVRTGDELGCELGDELGVQVGGGPGGQVGGPSVPVGAQGVGLSAC